MQSMKLSKPISASLVAVLALCHFSMAQAQERTLITLFGDSITYGYSSFGSNRGNGATDVGAPDRDLNQLLNGSGRPSTVANWGIGGSPTGPSGDPGLVADSNGLDRVSSNLATTLSLYPNHASRRFNVIMYGFNDRSWGIPSSTTGFNIEQIALRSISRGFVPIIGTIAPCKCSNTSLPTQNSAITSRYNAMRNQGREVYLVDQYNLLRGDIDNLLIGDGIHPNADGYQRIAQNWFNYALKDLIEANTSISAIVNFILEDDPPPP